MFPIKKENIDHLHSHNIRISELNSPNSSNMSQQHPRQIPQPKVRMLNPGLSAVRITNVKSLKEDPECVKRQEKEQSKSQQEIVNKSRQCTYPAYECTIPALRGRKYCARHILSDPTAPYKQCSYVSPSGNRCTDPAPIDRDAGLCFGHARSSLLRRMRAAAPPPPVDTTESLLNRLQHYVRPERTRTSSCASSISVVSDPSEQDIAPEALNPFKEIDAEAVNASASAAVMDCASASDSDADTLVVDSEPEISDTEDAPCELSPLWNAGVYTAEEVVSETIKVERSLQTLYKKEMEGLRSKLEMARSKYVRDLKAEREQHCSINTQARSGNLSVRERRQLRELKAYAGYHRRRGVDAVMARKVQLKRAMAKESAASRIPTQGRCIFTEGGVRCCTPSLPAAKHCVKHILTDRQQVLFTSCSDTRGPGKCLEPTPRPPLPHVCLYHTDPPMHAAFTLKKQESEGESEATCSETSP